MGEANGGGESDRSTSRLPHFHMHIQFQPIHIAILFMLYPDVLSYKL